MLFSPTFFHASSDDKSFKPLIIPLSYLTYKYSTSIIMIVPVQPFAECIMMYTHPSD